MSSYRVIPRREYPDADTACYKYVRWLVVERAKSGEDWYCSGFRTRREADEAAERYAYNDSVAMGELMLP